MFVANLLVELAFEILCPGKFILTIRPVNFVISFLVGGESRNHWKLPIVFKFRQIDDLHFCINLPRL